MMPYKLLFSLMLATALAAPQNPSSDPFYQAPPNSASAPPGTIFKNRTISAGNLGLLTGSVKATQLLYQTRALNGTSIATVTTVYVPKNAQAGKFISYQIAEDSALVDCAPSYGLQAGSNNSNPTIGESGMSLQVYLSKGYVVAAPDYEGPDAAFDSRIEGYGVLDGMRAVNTFLGGGQSIVGAGYSGGSIATGWAASLQNSYASDLPIKGWTIGGTPANTTGTLLYQANFPLAPFAGFSFIAFAGFGKPSANGTAFNSALQKYLTPAGSAGITYANTHCVGDVLSTYAGKSIISTDYNTLGAGLLNAPGIQPVLANATFGVNAAEKPIAPVLLYHAQFDEVIPYANATTLYNNWCGQGVNIHFTTYTVGGHISVANEGLSQAASYADQFFAGTAPTGCSTQTIL